MEINNNISDLLIKYLKDDLSEVERELLQSWLEKSERNRDLFEALIDEDKINEKLQKFNSIDKDAVWKKTLEKIGSEGDSDNFVPEKRIFPWYRIALVASVLIAISFFTYRSLTTTPTPKGAESEISDDIAPGGNKATLTLADGTIVSLDEASNGEIAEISGMKIRKTADGQVVYETDPAKTLLQSPEEEVRYNQIATPRGGQYQVVLPDGTKVWLNASSSLKYPIRFVGQARRVELSGEAYFEVNGKQGDNHKKIPFIVSTATQTVEVLGTDFNINAYENEQAVKTTLVEGLVQVSTNLRNGEIDKSKTVLLKPNQQSVLNTNQISVIPVDIESAVAWKEGYYKFNSEDLGSIMRKISRWYDVEIDFQGNTENYPFGGKISRKENISKVLEIIRETGNVHFKIEDSSSSKGKKILVLPAVEHPIQ